MLVSIDISLSLDQAFRDFVEDLTGSLRKLGMDANLSVGGQILQGTTKVGRVVSWEPGRRILLEWHPADWKTDETNVIELRFEPAQQGTRIVVEYSDWGGLLGDRGSELGGWFAREVVGPLLSATGPLQLGDWITDRSARQPSGAVAQAGYRDPLYHRPNFRAILQELRLTRDDYLLEVGCGGGAFLQEALRSGCKASAIDHSPDMVKTAQELNKEAVKEGRLEVSEGEANQLLFPSNRFSCAVMTNVFGFLPDPVRALKEIHRVLSRDGRLVVFAVSPEMRGTMAAPEPIASRIHFYNDNQMADIAKTAGFERVRVGRPDLTPFAREVGIPEDGSASFSNLRGQLLQALKS